jgi:membrane protease YdiL (CAAX protease family)
MTTRPTAPPPPPRERTVDRPALRPLMLFVSVALPLGGLLLGLSTVAATAAPFILAAVLLGLAGPALVLTYRDQGGAGVRRLLRDTVRLPTRWWWLTVAAFLLPAVVWTSVALMGGARPLSWELLGLYVADLLVGAALINLWEEMAWTGFAQRRAIGRWGLLPGTLLTAMAFAAIHVPLAVAGTATVSEAVRNVLLVACAATGLRLLIARTDPWSGGSLLTVGLLHSSFNASAELIDPAYDTVRVAMTVVVGFAVLALGARWPSAGPRPGRAV